LFIGLVVVLDAVLLVMPPSFSMLDMRLHYGAAEALAFLEELGPAGRTEYFVHECIDLVFIVAYTVLLWHLAVRWRLPRSAKVLLFAPGAADSVETAGILVLLAMAPPRSRLVAVVIGYATTCKWLALLAVVLTFTIATFAIARRRSGV
jgi:hypothetical protein